jgi:hypothetical protein
MNWYKSVRSELESGWHRDARSSSDGRRGRLGGTLIHCYFGEKNDRDGGKKRDGGFP